MQWVIHNCKGQYLRNCLLRDDGVLHDPWWVESIQDAEAYEIRDFACEVALAIGGFVEEVGCEQT